MTEDAEFYVGQKAFIARDGQVLILNDPEYGLDFPGGKIQLGEAKEGDPSSLAGALQREVREETGLEIEVGNPFAVWYMEYPKHHRNYPKVVYLVGFKCTYVSGEPVMSAEHNRFVWVTKETYRQFDDGGSYFAILDKYFQE